MKLAVLDTETTGLDPEVNQMLTIALILCDNDNILVKKLYNVKQQSWAKISKEALAVNGIDLIEHNKIAKSERDIILEIMQDLSVFGNEKPVILGQNVNFDINFMKAMFKRNNVGFPFYYKVLDTYSISAFLSECGIIDLKRFRLMDLCEYFNLEWGAHNALGDAESTLEVYKKLRGVVCSMKC